MAPARNTASRDSTTAMDGYDLQHGYVRYIMISTARRRVTCISFVGGVNDLNCHSSKSPWKPRLDW